MSPTLAKRQPAAIARYRDHDYGLGLLTVTSAGIARITVFAGPDLAARFGFPPAGEESTGQAPIPARGARLPGRTGMEGMQG